MSVVRVVAGMALLDASALGGAALAVVAVLSKRATRRIDRRPFLAAAVVALVALGVSAGLGTLKTAYPAVHDEFAYLLQADTFLHGRLTNPPPPLPEHFETFHVLVSPTYASKYPPAQGLALALGRFVFGSACAGVWLAFAAACVAVYWALGATLPRRFALAGALACALFPSFHDSGIYSWTQTFWGGQMSLLGGALLLGSAGRLAKRATALDGALLGAGLGILAMSRPFEGLIAAGLAGLGLARAYVRHGVPEGFLRRAAPPASAVVGLLLGWLLLVNARVTGSPIVFAFQKYEAQHAACPVAVWLPAIPPKTYTSPEFKAFYDQNLECWLYLRTLRGQLASGLFRIGDMLHYYAWPLTTAWIGLPFALLRKRARLLLGLLAAGTSISLTMTWLNPHYLAPFAPLGIVLAARSLRSLAGLPGRWALPGRLAVCVSFATIVVWLAHAGVIFSWSNNPTSWPGVHAEVARRVSADGSRALVVVERREGWSFHQEWVYNGADLDTEKVIWARGLDAKRDLELVDHFRDRVPWRLLLDREGWHLDRWTPAEPPRK